MFSPKAGRILAATFIPIVLAISISANEMALHTTASQLMANGDEPVIPTSASSFDDNPSGLATASSLSNGHSQWADDVSLPPTPGVQENVIECPELCSEGDCKQVCSLEGESLPDANRSITTDLPSSSPRAQVNIIDTGTVSRYQYESIDTALSYVSLPLCGVGAVVNILTVAVYVHPHMRSASSTYLACLSLAETIYLVLFPITVVPSLLWGSGAIYTIVYIVAGIYISNFVGISLRRTAFTLTFVVSLERFLAVTFPLKYKQLRFSGHPIRIAVLVALVVTILHLPTAFKYEIVSLGSGDRYSIKMRPFYQEQLDILGNLANACRVLFAYIPLLGTLLVNVLTTIMLKRHRRQASKLTSTKNASRSDKAELQTTVAILVSTVLFVLFSLPTNVQTLFQNYHPTYSWMKQEHYLFLVTNKVFSLLEVLSNIADFLAYLILSTSFRRTFRKMYCCLCCPPAGKQTASAMLPAVVTGTSGSTQASEMSTPDL